jgi:hypothetical protein
MSLTKIDPTMVGISSSGTDTTSELIIINDTDGGTIASKSTTEVFGSVKRRVVFHDKDVGESDQYIFIVEVLEADKDSINKLVQNKQLIRL